MLHKISIVYQQGHLDVPLIHGLGRNRDRDVSGRGLGTLAVDPGMHSGLDSWESAKIVPVKQTPKPMLFYLHQLFIRKFVNILDNVV